MRLYYFPPHKKGEPQMVYTHPIGIGKVGWSTPEGVTTVDRPREGSDLASFGGAAQAITSTTTARTCRRWCTPGPDNPLGKYEFTLGWPSYLIHGTNKPYGIGLRSSHGCVRLYPEDIEKLYAMVPNGTPVRVVNQPFLFGWHDQQLYLQAYTRARGR